MKTLLLLCVVKNMSVLCGQRIDTDVERSTKKSAEYSYDLLSEEMISITECEDLQALQAELRHHFCGDLKAPTATQKKKLIYSMSIYIYI